MILELDNLINQKLRIHRAISMSSQRQPVTGCFYAANVEIDLFLAGKDDEFKLTGTIKAPLICASHRSLATFEKTIDGDIDILFVPRDKLREDIEIELSDDDTNVQSYDSQLDLKDVVDEFVSLSLPMRIISPDEEKEDELAYSTNPNAGDEEQIDERLMALKEIKERMIKREDN